MHNYYAHYLILFYLNQYIGIIHGGVMSSSLTWDRRIILSLVPTSYCMLSKMCREYSRGDNVRFVGSKFRFFCVVLCYVMLCYVMICHGMLCCVMLCYVILCYALLCCDMLCHVMLCYVVLCYVTRVLLLQFL